MITRIQRHSSSALQPLDYNEQKCAKGQADVVHVANVRSDSFWAIRAAMKDRESHPGISRKTRYKGFHMSINPGPDDHVDEAAVISYIDDVMKELGYHDQPYAVYRHNDIEREHYHVVSVRIDEKGKVIRDSFSWLRTMRIQAVLAEKYGFRVGLEDDNIKSLPEPRRIRMSIPNMLQQMRANVTHVMSFFHDSPAEITAALRLYGITMKRGHYKGHEYVSFTAVDEHGKPLNRPVSAKKLLGMPFAEYHRTQLRSKSRITQTDMYLSEVESIRAHFARSVDMPDFRKRLYGVGIGMMFINVQGEAAKTKEDVRGAVFVIPGKKLCLSCSDCGLTIRDIFSKKKVKQTTQQVTSPAKKIVR